MSVRFSIKTEGFAELDAVLAELPKSTGKGVLRRSLLEVAEPIAEDFAARVERRSGELQDSIGASTRLSPRQAAIARREGKSSVEVYVGAGALPHAHLEEFGGPNNHARPALRPAWDAGWRRALDALAAALWAQIEKTRARMAKKAERLAAKIRAGG